MTSILKVDNLQDASGTGSPYIKDAVLQVKHFQTGEVANTGGSTMPSDDTILQSDEGTEFMSLSITPKSASSKLLIQIVLVGSANNGTRQITSGLFQDSGSSAIASAAHYQTTGTGITTVNYNHYMTSGTTSSTTFKVRAGSHSGTYTFNGYNSTTRTMGGVAASSITIMEIGG